MAYGPPSYQAAAYRQLWMTIAPYVQSRDLYSACLVSREWHRIFAPLLWGNPASRFGPESDAVYLSLTRFKRLLIRARLDVRRLAHTLHIPPAQPEFYDGPQAGWLRNILDRLPCLQSLIVSNLSFFDHQSLQTVHQGCGEPYPNPTRYALRLLIARDCENTTASGLHTALLHFPDLMYLDLSSTQGVRNHYVLRYIGSLSDLTVLKLSNCGLRDDDIEVLSFSKQLRSLDVSHNLLTERGIAKLFGELPAANEPLRRSRAGTYNVLPSPSPFCRRYSGIPLPAKVFADGMERYVARHLTNGLDGHILMDEGLPTTFTHLYLAGNYLTIEGLSRILNYPSLQLVDCGSMNLSQRPEMPTPSSPGAESRILSNHWDIERLSPALFMHAFRNLRSLRIHHSLITSYPFSGREELAPSEHCFELHSEDLRFELDSTEVLKPGTMFELDDTSVTPSSASAISAKSSDPSKEEHASFESPDDVGVVVNQTAPTKPIAIQRADTNGTVKPRDSYKIPRKGIPPRISISAYSGHEEPRPVTHAPRSVPDGPETFTYNYAKGPERPWQEALSHRPKATSIKDLLEEITQRRHRIEARERHTGRFKPSMLPNLKTLTLTDIPTQTHRRDVTESLSLFIQECGEEEELARLEELATHQDSNLNPMWNRATARILKLQRLVLEMSSTPEPYSPRSPGSRRSSRGKRDSYTKSSTKDADSEMFMEKSESDFSFFSEDDGGLLVSEGRIDSPVMFGNGMIYEHGDGHLLDVVAELSSMRREKRAKHEANERFDRCKIEEALLGHWRGEVKVVKLFGAT